MGFSVRKDSNDLSMSQFVDITLEEKLTAMMNLQVSTLAKQIEEKFEQNENSLKEKLGRVSINLLEMENKNDALIKDNKLLKSQVSNLMDNVEKITTEKTELVKKVEEQAVKISDLNLAVEGLQQDNGLLRETIKITQKENEELKTDNKKLEDERSQNQQTVFKLSGEVDKLKGNITSLEQENLRLTDKKIKLKRDKAQLLADKEQLEKTNKELEAQKNKEIKELESQFKASEEERREFEAQKNKEIKELESQFKASEEERRELEAQKNKEIKELESQFKASEEERRELGAQKNKEIEGLESQFKASQEKRQELEAQINKIEEEYQSKFKASQEKRQELEAQINKIEEEYQNKLKASQERMNDLENQREKIMLDLESTRFDLENEVRVNIQLNMSNRMLSMKTEQLETHNRLLEREKTSLKNRNAELQEDVALLNETILIKDQRIIRDIREQQNLQNLITELRNTNAGLALQLNEARETIRLRDVEILQRNQNIERLNQQVEQCEGFITRIKQPLKDKGLEVDNWNADQIAGEIGRLLDQKATLDAIKGNLRRENIQFDDNIPKELIDRIATLITSSKNFTEIKNKFIAIGLNPSSNVEQMKNKIQTLKDDGQLNAANYNLYKEFYDHILSALHNNRYLPTRNERKAKVVKNPKHVTQNNKALIKEASQKDSKYDLEIKHVEAILSEVITRSGLSRFFMNIGK